MGSQVGPMLHTSIQHIHAIRPPITPSPSAKPHGETRGNRGGINDNHATNHANNHNTIAVRRPSMFYLIPWDLWPS